MELLSLKHFSKYHKSCIPTTEITCDYGFTKIKWEAAFPSFLGNYLKNTGDRVLVLVKVHEVSKIV